MVCFYIAVNTESGACTAPPERRGALQAVSLVVQVVIWVTVVVGLVLVGDSGFVELQLIMNGLTGNRSPLGGPAYSSFSQGTSYLRYLLFSASSFQNTFRAVASMIFFMGNLSYLVASLILAILTLHAKLSGRQEATKKRPKVETCCSICSPYNGLTILHHLEHRGGVGSNLITLLLCIPVQTSTAEFNTVPPQLWLCAPLFLLCLVQAVLSLLYMEEMALCGLGACCVYFLWVRRTPNPGHDAIPMA